jgi:hemolysin III
MGFITPYTIDNVKQMGVSMSHTSQISSPKNSEEPSMQAKAYSVIEEWLNSISHGIGFVAAIVGLVFMLYRADNTLALTTAAIYGSTLILMFLSSTLYHAITHQKAKGWLKLFDHSAIYLLIAGTYTPLLLVSIGGVLGITMTAVIWCLALGGVTFKLVAQHRFPKVSVMTYLLMGWIALGLIYPLYMALPGAGLWLLVAGGICFSVGVCFYVAKKVKYTHAIWHLFVIGGCSCHYFSIYYFVV